MLNKETIAQWIKTIDEQRAKLRVGGGALISANYSKVNNALYDHATALRNLLVLYYSYERIGRQQLENIKDLSDTLYVKASAYEVDKTKDGKTAPAKGDKKTRFDAAKALKQFSTALSEDITAHNQDYIGGEQLSEGFSEIENEYLDPTGFVTGEDVKKAVDSLSADKGKKLYMKRLDFHYRACEAVEESDSALNDNYDYLEDISEAIENDLTHTTAPRIAADFKKNIADLHRLVLLRYEDEEQFLNLYKNNRHKIKQVVEVYKWIKKGQSAEGDEKEKYEAVIKSMGYDSPEGYFKKFMAGVGLKNTPEDIDKMEDRIAAFEMIGRRYDNEMAMYTNHAFATMSATEIKNIVKMKDGELENKLSDLNDKVNNNKASADETNRRNLYAAVLKNRELAKIKVDRVDKGYKKAEKSYLDREVGGDLKRRFKFLTASSRMGRKSMLDYYAGDFDIPVSLKAKVGKVSLKYNKEFKYANVSAGTHVGFLGARAVGNVGFGVATADPLNWPKASVNLMGTAELYGARGVAKGWIGGKYAGVDAKAMGHIGHAKAEGGASVGYIYQTDDKGNVTAEGYGASAKAGATAAVFQGKVTTGINILGIMVRWETEGYAVGVGAKTEATFTTGGCKFGAAGCLGLGLGFFLVIDWRGFKDKLERWKKRRGISKEALKQKKAEEKGGKKIGIDESGHKLNGVDKNFADELINAGNISMADKDKKRSASVSQKKPDAKKQDVKKRSDTVSSKSSVKSSIRKNTASQNHGPATGIIK